LFSVRSISRFLYTTLFRSMLFFRDSEFPDDADARALEAAFRGAFPQRDEDYEKLFVFHPEDPEKIFADAAEPQDYQGAILSVLVDRKSTRLNSSHVNTSYA